MSSRAEIRVEVLYAEPLREVSTICRLDASATVADALRMAGADAAFSGIDLQSPAVGIFGRLVSPMEPLIDGDRVELYRPLAADPKTARRARAREARRRR